MKPISGYQKNIAELSKRLPAITEKQKQWAYEHCFSDDAYYHKGEVWCLRCGEVFEKECSPLAVDLLGDEAVCPKCGRKLKLKNSRKTRYEEKWYYTIVTTLKGYQVCRHFIAEKHMYKTGKDINVQKKPYYHITEAVQCWIDETGKETIMARPCKGDYQIYDHWDFSKPIEIRSRSKTRYAHKYDINAYYVYPQKRVLPVIKRNGYTSRFTGIPLNRLFCMLLSDREAEMLIKTKQYELLRHKWQCGGHLRYPHAVKVANRRKYIIKDASMWMDYLDLLFYFKRDTHNAYYVCPGNLKAEHDRLLEKKMRIEEEKAKEEKIKEAKRWEEQYRRDKGRFFGICFGNDNIQITVINSVAEMAEEGKKMRHCVYNLDYYKKPDSLILSAKSRDGERIETIELNLSTYQVIQSRGKFNMNTEYHDEIIKLVNDNIGLIKAAS